MKKIIILTLAIVLLSGCGPKKEAKKETLNCFFQNTSEGSEFKTDIAVNVENDIVKYAKATMTYEDKNLAKTMCDIFKKSDDASDDLKCGDNFIIIDNYHKSISSEELSKTDFLKYMESQQFICENK